MYICPRHLWLPRRCFSYLEPVFITSLKAVPDRGTFNIPLPRCSYFSKGRTKLEDISVISASSRLGTEGRSSLLLLFSSQRRSTVNEAVPPCSTGPFDFSMSSLSPSGRKQWLVRRFLPRCWPTEKSREPRAGGRRPVRLENDSRAPANYFTANGPPKFAAIITFNSISPSDPVQSLGFVRPPATPTAIVLTRKLRQLRVPFSTSGINCNATHPH